MKTPSRLLVASTILVSVLASCNDETSVKAPEIRPVRLEMDGYHRELVFDQQNRVSKVKMTSFFPGDVTLESFNEFMYRGDGKCDRCSTTSDYSCEYTYEGGRLIRTDEYIDGVFTQYHVFAYNSRNRVTEMVSWQLIPEEGQWIPHSKSTFAYDINDNLVESVLYYYHTGTEQHEMLSTFLYSEFDNKRSADHFFDIVPLNPYFRFRKNNPGKMIVKNMHGNITSIDQYTYQYNSAGYPEKRMTTTTFPHNGQTGTYEINYVYETK